MKRSATGFEPESSARRRMIIAGGLGVLAAGIAPQLLAQGARATPSIGYTWRYQYRSDWRTVAPQTIDYTVVEVSPTAIRDRMTVAGLPGEDLQTFTARIEEVNRSLPGFVASEFSPYLQAFTALAPGTRLEAPTMPRDSMFGLPWSIWVKVAAPERVTVPAGTFDAIRVELTGSRPPAYLNTVAEPAYLYQTVWFAPGPKRVVRQHLILQAWALNQLQRDHYELASFKVA